MTRQKRSPLRALTPDELTWLTANHSRCSAQRIARELGVTDYIAVKLMIHHGLRDPARLAPKYQPRLKPPPTWQRPCMRCRSTAPRPRNLYLCEPCRKADDEPDPDPDFLAYSRHHHR